MPRTVASTRGRHAVAGAVRRSTSPNSLVNAADVRIPAGWVPVVHRLAYEKAASQWRPSSSPTG